MNFSKVSKNLLALSLAGYFTLSPITTLAITQPVSAPVSIPISVPVPIPTPKPVYKPDLIIENVNILGNHIIGSKDEVEITVANSGTGDTKQGFWVSVNVYNTSGIKVENFNVPFDSIKAGKKLTRKLSYIINSATPAGLYKVNLSADYLNNIDESNEKNNNYTILVNVVKPVVISYINPSKANAGDIAAVYGSNFGNKAGNINFYNQRGQASGGAPVISWYNGGVKFRIPAIAKGNYTVEIQTSDGRKSNKVPFTVLAGQPQISLIQPNTLKVNQYFIIFGQELGASKGLVKFIQPKTGLVSGSAGIYFWSDFLIIGYIPNNIKANNEYGIQITTSDSRNSSLLYRTISK